MRTRIAVGILGKGVRSCMQGCIKEHNDFIPEREQTSYLG